MSEQTPTVTSNDDDVMLDAVTKFIADKEKFRSKSYLVGGKGNPTIGYGFEYYDKDTPVEMGQTMTKEQAIPLLKENSPIPNKRVIVVVNISTMKSYRKLAYYS